MSTDATTTTATVHTGTVITLWPDHEGDTVVVIRTNGGERVMGRDWEPENPEESGTYLGERVHVTDGTVLD